MEKRIEIVEDIEGRIVYDEIERKDLNRSDVEAAKAEIERIEAENASFLAKIEENKARIEAIKAQIADAEKVIAIADAKKAAEEQEAAQGDVANEDPSDAPQM